MRKQRRVEKSIQAVIYIIEGMFLLFVGVLYGYHDKVNVIIAILATFIMLLSFYVIATSKALYDTRKQ